MPIDGVLLSSNLRQIEGDAFRSTIETVPTIVEFEDDVAIVSIDMGRSFGLLLDDTNCLYGLRDFSTGPCQIYLMCGLNDDDPCSPHIDQLSAGWSMAAILSRGQIYVWEMNWPLDDVTEKSISPVRVEVGEESTDEGTEVVGVVVAENFLVYLTRQGVVYKVHINLAAFAENSNAPLVPIQLIHFVSTNPLAPISHIRGAFHSFAVYNKTGLVMIGHKNTTQNTRPLIMPELQNCGVLDISWGDYHVLAVKENGELITWGCESKHCGSFGLGSAATAKAKGAVQHLSDLILESPVRVDRFLQQRVFKIAAGGWQSAALVLPNSNW